MAHTDASKFDIRRAGRGELNLVLEWAAQEGWNPGLADADCFHASDPDGFLVGFFGDDPVGCVSMVRYGAAFCFLGFYMVRPELRGRGHGYRIWQAAIARAANCTVGLDGVIAQQDNYSKSGFLLAHRNIRYGGIASCHQVNEAGLTPVSSKVAEAVVRYDRPFFPDVRDTFLRCWLQPDRRIALTSVEDGSLRGYGVIRTCRTGCKIGRLFADTPRHADVLFRALAAAGGGGPIFIDCPEPNASATELASRHGLSPVFETARMYRGAAPDLPLARMYGITTFELG
jgi:GNAT superfamily N-acetyltransferase